MKENKFRLSDIDRELPFKVPENYFDNFYANLKAKIETEEVVEIPKRNVVHLSFNWKRAISIAASILLFIILFKTSNIETNISNYSLEDEFANLTEYELYSLIEYQQPEDQLSNDEIFNYLNSTASDYELYVELNK